MQVAILMIGMILGATAATAAMVAGHTVWMALAIYSGVGSLTVVAMIAIGWAAWYMREELNSDFGATLPEPTIRHN